MRYSIPAAEIEFDEGGNTIWVHGPQGATILRLKTMGKINVRTACENICSHADIIVPDDIEVCVVDADKQVANYDDAPPTFREFLARARAQIP